MSFQSENVDAKKRRKRDQNEEDVDAKQKSRRDQLQKSEEDLKKAELERELHAIDRRRAEITIALANIRCSKLHRGEDAARCLLSLIASRDDRKGLPVLISQRKLDRLLQWWPDEDELFYQFAGLKKERITVLLAIYGRFRFDSEHNVIDGSESPDLLEWNTLSTSYDEKCLDDALINNAVVDCLIGELDEDTVSADFAFEPSDGYGGWFSNEETIWAFFN